MTRQYFEEEKMTGKLSWLENISHAHAYCALWNAIVVLLSANLKVDFIPLWGGPANPPKSTLSYWEEEKTQ